MPPKNTMPKEEKMSPEEKKKRISEARTDITLVNARITILIGFAKTWEEVTNKVGLMSEYVAYKEAILRAKKLDPAMKNIQALPSFNYLQKPNSTKTDKIYTSGGEVSISNIDKQINNVLKTLINDMPEDVIRLYGAPDKVPKWVIDKLPDELREKVKADRDSMKSQSPNPSTLVAGEEEEVISDMSGYVPLDIQKRAIQYLVYTKVIDREKGNDLMHRLSVSDGFNFKLDATSFIQKLQDNGVVFTDETEEGIDAILSGKQPQLPQQEDENISKIRQMLKKYGVSDSNINASINLIKNSNDDDDMPEDMIPIKAFRKMSEQEQKEIVSYISNAFPVRQPQSPRPGPGEIAMTSTGDIVSGDNTEADEKIRRSFETPNPNPRSRPPTSPPLGRRPGGARTPKGTKSNVPPTGLFLTPAPTQPPPLRPLRPLRPLPQLPSFFTQTSSSSPSSSPSSSSSSSSSSAQPAPAQPAPAQPVPAQPAPSIGNMGAILSPQELIHILDTLETPTNSRQIVDLYNTYFNGYADPIQLKPVYINGLAKELSSLGISNEKIKDALLQFSFDKIQNNEQMRLIQEKIKLDQPLSSDEVVLLDRTKREQKNREVSETVEKMEKDRLANVELHRDLDELHELDIDRQLFQLPEEIPEDALDRQTYNFNRFGINFKRKDRLNDEIYGDRKYLIPEKPKPMFTESEVLAIAKRARELGIEEFKKFDDVLRRSDQMRIINPEYQHKPFDFQHNLFPRKVYLTQAEAERIMG